MSASDRALFELVMPMDKQFRPVEDPELDRARRQARRTRNKPGENHPFDAEHKMSPEELYEQVDPQARKIFDLMPGLKDEKDLRKRVTRGVAFWAEFYEHRFNALLEVEQHKWDHEQKIAALKKKREQLIEKAQSDIQAEMVLAAREKAQKEHEASEKMKAEMAKYPDWYTAAEKLEAVLK